MKEIKAYIKKIRLNAVIRALHRIEGLTGASISEVSGFGRGLDRSSTDNLSKEPSDNVRHVKIEVVCVDELEDRVVEVIHTAAHTGLRGDGRIFVSDISRSVRVQDRLKGKDAV